MDEETNRSQCNIYITLATVCYFHLEIKDTNKNVPLHCITVTLHVSIVQWLSEQSTCLKAYMPLEPHIFPVTICNFY